MTLFLVFISCKNVTNKETEQVQIVVDSTGLKIETVEKNSGNLRLTSFLENPIDLQDFKSKKKQSLSTVMNGKEYYLNPKINDSILYLYSFLPNVPFQSKIEQLEIVVFKFGKNKHSWEDNTEILIELNVKAQDINLGKANLVGLSKTELESEFGTEYLTFDNAIVYSNKNRVLIVEFSDSKIKSYNYIKLNTEKIDKDLIGQIIK
ncbi:hypothetical protein [Algibacter lectus]|uniref:Uncharacterized protein n=1 Tax=Algibacter lectus TaxID=221126 RepID=A0A4R8MJQ2_9FLAO|nr:hypothetical protein [Algibacter lectus]MWW26906.1 hypothetical protein [Algibacter lectus]TDY65278.1 hypothetical protein DFQ06_0204 [Algibacter lectus]